MHLSYEFYLLCYYICRSAILISLDLILIPSLDTHHGTSENEATVLRWKYSANNQLQQT